MLKIGLTGNIGSGKTVVSDVFSTLDIPVYHSDEESKKFLTDPSVKNEIVKHFGYGILTNGHEINRRSLASIVFSDNRALNLLNSILHPRVKSDFRTWASLHSEKPYVIQEAAIIFESGFRPEFDYIIQVTCPKETAIERIVKRDKIDRHSMLLRMQFQMDEEEKTHLSDFVIRNDGSEMIIPQVLSIHKQLLEIGPKRNDDVSPGAADA
ncbi:MAG: dephospho-CoA kinase [Bacteroidales bacterium]|nr:dephospho-CoA kinase [Bacteroidales bacterium]